MKTLLLITATLASGIAYAEGELPDRQTELPAVEKPQDNKYLVPRDLVDIPAGEFGDKLNWVIHCLSIHNRCAVRSSAMNKTVSTATCKRA